MHLNLIKGDTGELKRVKTNFGKIIFDNIDSYKNITICVGYVSTAVLEKVKTKLIDKTKKGGIVKLIVGMAYFEGLTEKCDSLLREINKSFLSVDNGSGVFIPVNNKLHGKMYMFQKDDLKEYFVGSSNFSDFGLDLNIEFNVIMDQNMVQNADVFFQEYLASDHVMNINDVKIPLKKYSPRGKLILKSFEEFDTDDIELDNESKLQIPLERYADRKRARSSLNKFFGSGRKGKQRDWYEIELVCPKLIRENPLYPKGEFTAYTTDGYKIPMKTAGTEFKNLESKGDLTLFGKWLKGKLEHAGALNKFEPFTLDTIEIYGKKTLDFYKITDKEYYVDFEVT